MPRRTYYAVKTGWKTGVFSTWKECEKQVKNFPNAKYEKFATQNEAAAFVEDHDVASSAVSNPSTNKRALSPEIDNHDVVYCDGACKGNGQHGPVAGVGVWWDYSDPRNLSERCPGDQTNNRAELVAIVRVLETASTSTVPLIIKTDSQYCCDSLQSWLPTWEKNGYKTAAGHPVKNIGLILYVKALLDARKQAGQDVKLEHVRGHSGIPGNEAADALANQGTILPPKQDRDWKTLEREVRCKIADMDTNSKLSSAENTSTKSKNSPNKARKISLDESRSFPSVSPSSSPPEKTHPIQLPFSRSSRDAPKRNFRSNAKFNPPTTEFHDFVEPEDIDFGLYADCLLEEHELWKDLSD